MNICPVPQLTLRVSFTEFLRKKNAASVPQQNYRARCDKIRFNKIRRAAITIQAFTYYNWTC